MNKIIVLVTLVITLYSIASAIEVGGHLTEDTVWTPENNPYLVTSGIYVNSDVTLTILPGTIVKFNSDYYTEIGDDQFYFSSGEEPIAKFIRCEGKIIAEGTEQDSIVFTRIQDEQYYHWGTIYLPEEAEFSVFKHCTFKYSAVTGFDLAEQPRGAIAVWNGSAIIENCTFIDNHRAIHIQRSVDEIQILNNYFDYNDFLYPHIMNSSPLRFISEQYISDDYPYTRLLIGNNIFRYGNAISSDKSVTFIDNNVNTLSETRTSVYLSSTQGISYFYNNEFGSCHKGIYTFASEEDSLYIRNNHFATDGGYGINISDAYVEISDNYFEGCKLQGPSEIELIGKVSNNIINNTNIAMSGRFEEMYNNIIFNCGMVSSVVGSSNIFQNNLMINIGELCNLLADTSIIENIIIINTNIDDIDIMNNPIFRNCILDFELPEECIDGGGNIIVDSLQAQTIFEDLQNGNFHLAPNSIAIDAGFDTLDYYYPFDIDYNQRVWDGDGNGNAIIDIGAYEYGAPALGGIEGTTYDPTTGDFVDYVLIKINNEPGEFTFSDSIGSYQYKLPTGFYDVYVERVFYEDAVEYQIEVFDGEFTQLDIAMCETVNVQNFEIIPTASDFNLSNYPNPFNPTTTISFSIQNDIKVELLIFNIKGQKINTLINDRIIKGKHSIVWSGCDQKGNHVSSGIYLYKLKVGNQESVKRMLLLK